MGWQIVDLAGKLLQLCIMHFNCKSCRLVNDVFISEVLSITAGIKIGKLMLVAGKCGLANIMNYDTSYQFGHRTLFYKSTKLQ